MCGQDRDLPRLPPCFPHLQLLPGHLLEASNAKGASRLAGSSCFPWISITIQCSEDLGGLSFPDGLTEYLGDNPRCDPRTLHCPTNTTTVPRSPITPAPPTCALLCPPHSLIPHQHHFLPSSLRKQDSGCHMLCLSASRTAGQFQLNLTERWGRPQILLSYITKISRQAEK